MSQILSIELISFHDKKNNAINSTNYTEIFEVEKLNIIVRKIKKSCLDFFQRTRNHYPGSYYVIVN